MIKPCNPATKVASFCEVEGLFRSRVYYTLIKLMLKLVKFQLFSSGFFVVFEELFLLLRKGTQHAVVRLRFT